LSWSVCGMEHEIRCASHVWKKAMRATNSKDEQ
jgi:hypothetical protein